MKKVKHASKRKVEDIIHANENHVAPNVSVGQNEELLDNQDLTIEDITDEFVEVVNDEPEFEEGSESEADLVDEEPVVSEEATVEKKSGFWSLFKKHPVEEEVEADEPNQDELIETVVESESDLDLDETSNDATEVKVVEEVVLENEATEEVTEEIEEEIEEEVVVEEEKKTGFWTHFKKQVAEEEVEVVSEPREKEEKVVMSYSAKQSGYGSEADAIISASMVITGNIELETGLVFAGKIIGNVSCKDTVESKAGGSIEGDLSALSAEFVGGSVKGNVTVGERVVVDEETVIEGGIKAKDIVISGKVVGEIKAENSVRLTSSAVIKGDLFAASISIETGAKVEGKFVVQS
jgi:cytoskeletal protein CcmA (bactofilin family)